MRAQTNRPKTQPTKDAKSRATKVKHPTQHQRPPVTNRPTTSMHNRLSLANAIFIEHCQIYRYGHLDLFIDIYINLVSTKLSVYRTLQLALHLLTQQ